eukprot:2343150-Alexandrium_andersonii.AAC.1
MPCADFTAASARPLLAWLANGAARQTISWSRFCFTDSASFTMDDSWSVCVTTLCRPQLSSAAMTNSRL